VESISTFIALIAVFTSRTQNKNILGWKNVKMKITFSQPKFKRPYKNYGHQSLFWETSL